MKSQKRKEFILDYLKKNQSAKTQSLSQDLNVTRETIRKDLYELEKLGQITIMHGGAVINQFFQETEFEKRKSKMQEAKKEIAELAINFIKEQDVIYLGYGTTNYTIAEALQNIKDITVVTHSLPIIELLAKKPNINLVTLGGIYNRKEEGFYGTFALNSLENIFVNIAFISCSGVNVKGGITDEHAQASLFYKIILEHARYSVAVCDHSKFALSKFNKVANLNEVDCILTDSKTNKQLVQELKEAGAQIVYYKDN